MPSAVDESWGPFLEAKSHREEAIPGVGGSGRRESGEAAQLEKHFSLWRPLLDDNTLHEDLLFLSH